MSTPRSSSRRDEIIEIACRIFSEKGFRATSMRDIAEAVGMLPGSLYSHVASKDEILQEFLQRYWTRQIQEFEAAINSSADAADVFVSFIVNAILDTERDPVPLLILHNDWLYLRNLDGFEFLDQRAVQAEKLWCDVYRKAVEDGVFRGELDEHLVYRTVQGAVFWVIRWYQASPRWSMSEIVAVETSILLAGIVKPGAPMPSIPTV